METGQASKTALRVAIRRAAHQLADPPPVLDDPIALRLIGSGYARDLDRAMEKVARDFRAFMAARSRYVEDRLAEAVALGATQYVVLGAGPRHLRLPQSVFLASSLRSGFSSPPRSGSAGLLRQAGISAPDLLTFVPLDFEHKRLAAGLAEAGFDGHKPAFFGWLGVVPYLTIEAFRATLSDVAKLPPGTAIGFDYAVPPETLSPGRRLIFDRLAARVAAAGEPFRLFFTPEQIESELRTAGFGRIEQVDSEHLNELYFRNRADGLRLSPVGIGILATAWVQETS